MPCVDNSYYTVSFGGKTVPVESFDAYARRAEDYLRAVTFGAFSSHTADSSVKDAVCAVAETLFSIDEGGGITEEKVGEVSVSYARGISNTDPASVKLRNVALQYLGESGLMYRGTKNAK